MHKAGFAIVALPLTLALAACGDQEAQSEEQVQAATLDQPGIDDTAVTTDQAISEASDLAAHLASGDLETAEAAAVLEDLDRLVNANLPEFPEAMRPSLTEDIQSARAALEAKDMEGVKEAATRIGVTLAGGEADPA